MKVILGIILAFFDKKTTQSAIVDGGKITVSMISTIGLTVVVMIVGAVICKQIGLNHENSMIGATIAGVVVLTIGCRYIGSLISNRANMVGLNDQKEVNAFRGNLAIPAYFTLIGLNIFVYYWFSPMWVYMVPAGLFLGLMFIIHTVAFTMWIGKHGMPLFMQQEKKDDKILSVTSSMDIGSNGNPFHRENTSEAGLTPSEVAKVGGKFITYSLTIPFIIIVGVIVVVSVANKFMVH